MVEWKTMTKLFALMRTITAEMAEGLPSSKFGVASGNANCPKCMERSVLAQRNSVGSLQGM